MPTWLAKQPCLDNIGCIDAWLGDLWPAVEPTMTVVVPGFLLGSSAAATTENTMHARSHEE